jgi:hypothetical protein
LISISQQTGGPPGVVGVPQTSVPGGQTGVKGPDRLGIMTARI